MPTSQQSAVLDRFLDQLVDCFTPGVARQITELQADPKLQERVAELRRKAHQGSLTENEAREFSRYVDAFDLIGALQDKARMRCGI